MYAWSDGEAQPTPWAAFACIQLIVAEAIGSILLFRGEEKQRTLALVKLIP